MQVGREAGGFLLEGVGSGEGEESGGAEESDDVEDGGVGELVASGAREGLED